MYVRDSGYIHFLELCAVPEYVENETSADIKCPVCGDIMSGRVHIRRKSHENVASFYCPCVTAVGSWDFSIRDGVFSALVNRDPAGQFVKSESLAAEV